MSHIADITTEDGITLHLNSTEDGITLHLNSTAGRVDLTASRAHPAGLFGLVLMALAVTSLTAQQLLKLADACQGAARAVALDAVGEPSNDPRAFDELAAAQYRADIAEAELAKKGRWS